MRLRGREGFPDCEMFEAEHLTCSRIWSSTGYLTALAGHLCGKFNSAARQARMVHLWKALSFLHKWCWLWIERYKKAADLEGMIHMELGVSMII